MTRSLAVLLILAGCGPATQSDSPLQQLRQPVDEDATPAWQVRSRVRKTLLALYGASEREATLKKQEAIQAESVRLLDAQLKAGAVSPFEVTQSRVALNQTRSPNSTR